MKEAVLSSKLTRLNIDEVAYKRWHARWVSYFSTLHMSGSRYMPSQVPALDACAYASCYSTSKSIFFLVENCSHESSHECMLSRTSMGPTVVIGTKRSARVSRMQRTNSSHGMMVDM